MKKALIFIIISLLFSGCLYVNDRGVSTRLYNDCKEYYDATGMYHKDCDENLIDYKDLNLKNFTQ